MLVAILILQFLSISTLGIRIHREMSRNKYFSRDEFWSSLIFGVVQTDGQTGSGAYEPTVTCTGRLKNAHGRQQH